MQGLSIDVIGIQYQEIDNHSTDSNIQNIPVTIKRKKESKTNDREHKQSRIIAAEHSKRDNNKVLAISEPGTTRTHYGNVMCKPKRLIY